MYLQSGHFANRVLVVPNGVRKHLVGVQSRALALVHEPDGRKRHVREGRRCNVNPNPSMSGRARFGPYASRSSGTGTSTSLASWSISCRH